MCVCVCVGGGVRGILASSSRRIDDVRSVTRIFDKFYLIESRISITLPCMEICKGSDVIIAEQGFEKDERAEFQSRIVKLTLTVRRSERELYGNNLDANREG